MNPVFIFLTLLGFSLSAKGQKIIQDPYAQVREVGTFSAISISGAFDIVLTQSDETVVVVSASDANLRNLITTEVRDKTLYLGIKKSNFDFRSSRKLKAYISFPSLDRVEMGGSGNIRVEGVLKVKDLKVRISGSSDFSGTIEANDLSLTTSGSSDYRLAGSVENLKILVSGSSDVKAFGLISNNCDITCSGNSTIEVTVNNELQVAVSGTSAIHYKGDGVVTKQNISGKSSIEKKG